MRSVAGLSIPIPNPEKIGVKPDPDLNPDPDFCNPDFDPDPEFPIFSGFES